MVRLFGRHRDQMQRFIFVVLEERLFRLWWSPAFQFFNAPPHVLIASGNRRLREVRTGRCGWQLDPDALMTPGAHANKRVNGAWRNLKVSFSAKNWAISPYLRPFRRSWRITSSCGSSFERRVFSGIWSSVTRMLSSIVRHPGVRANSSIFDIIRVYSMFEGRHDRPNSSKLE